MLYERAQHVMQTCTVCNIMYLLLHTKGNTDHTVHFHNNTQEHYLSLSLCTSHLDTYWIHVVQLVWEATYQCSLVE